MAIEIDECYRNIKCDYCFKIIDKKLKYYYDVSNSILPSFDVCKECSYKYRLM